MHLFYIYFYVHAFDLLIFKLLHCFKCTYTTDVSLDAVCLCQTLIFYIYVYKGISSSVATHVNPYQCVSPSVQTTDQVQLSRLQSWSYYWRFTKFQFRFNSPKEKRNLKNGIFSTKCFVYKFAHDLPNDVRLRMTEKSKMLKYS